MDLLPSDIRNTRSHLFFFFWCIRFAYTCHKNVLLQAKIMSSNMDTVSLNTSGGHSWGTESPSLSIKSWGFTNDTDSCRSQHWNFFLAANFINVGKSMQPCFCIWLLVAQWYRVIGSLASISELVVSIIWCWFSCAEFRAFKRELLSTLLWLKPD